MSDSSFYVKARPERDCDGCGAALPLIRHYKTYLCDSCKEVLPCKTGESAHKLVAMAIRLGFLRTISECVCVDCGARATDYDHRDYSKPLDVDPVCRPCNFRRGPAKPFFGIDRAKKEAA